MMMERDEHEREQRIRRNAEISRQNSKLFPRMQKLEDDKKRAKEDLLESERDSVTNEGPGFPFAPSRARSVPDFRKIQKAFITKLEQNKKSKAVTKPIPFKFNQARPSAKLRTYMDQQN
jgi:hypothetical protein